MSFQWIIDNAESISLVKRPVVSQTVSRDQRIRTVSRGGNVWKFAVKMPDTMLWSSSRGYLEYNESALLAPQTINFAKSSYDWITKYRGDATTTTTMTFKYTTAQAASDTTKFELGNVPGATGSTVFRAGDLVQATGSNYVYSVASTVVKSATTTLVSVHRSILNTPSATAVILKVGPAVAWQVICTSMPTWTLIGKDLISINGSFEFQEVI
jgi:hypothetical protein